MTRKTWHYDPEVGELVEGPAPRKTDSDSGDGYRFSDRLYSGAPFKAPDGTVIDSRKKHREYMRRNNLATVDDFKGTWKEAEKRREAVYTGRHDTAQRREQVARAMEKFNGR